MVEFGASALLDIEIDQGSLRSARRTIEDDLGGVNVRSPRPSGGGGGVGGAIGSSGPEPATIDLSRRQLGEQELLVELAEERNDLLEDGFGEAGGGGRGGGILAGFGARSLIGGAGIGAGGPFAALAVLTGLGLLGASQADGTDDQRGTGRGGQDLPGGDGTTRVGGAGNQIQVPSGAARFFDNLGGDPAGTFRPIPDSAPRGGGTVNNNVNVQADATVSVNVPDQGPTESEIQRFAQAAARNEAQKVADKLRQELAGETGATAESTGAGRFFDNLGGDPAGRVE